MPRDSLSEEGLFYLAGSVIGRFEPSGRLLVRNPHGPADPGLDNLGELVAEGHGAAVAEALSVATTSGRACAEVMLRGNTVRAELRLWTDGPATVLASLAPVDPEACLAHAITGSVASGIALTDAAGRFHFVNAAYAAIYGYERNELLGGRFTDRLDPGDREAAMDRHRRMIAGEVESTRNEYQVLRRDGTACSVDVWSRRLVLPGGVFRLATVNDITPLRRSENELAETEARYRHIFEQTREGIFRSTRDGRLLEVNWPLVRMHYCQSKEELLAAVGDIATDWYVDPAARDEIVGRLERFDRVDNFEAEVRRIGSGERFWTSESVTAVRDSQGRLLYFQGTVRDVTRQRRRRELAASRSEILQKIARNHDLTQILYEVTAAIEQFHPPMTVGICRVRAGQLWVEAAPGLAESCIEMLDGQPLGGVPGPLGRLLRGHRESPIRGRAGEDFTDGLADAMAAAGYTDLAAFAVRDQDGHMLGAIIGFTARHAASGDDIRDMMSEMAQMVSLAFEQRRLTDQLVYQARYDNLTGLPNRTLFAERLTQLMADAERHRYSLAVMMLDLDEFKLVNDTLGHHVGDRLLQQVAQRLQRCLRAGDTVARFGGDEFVILLPIDEDMRVTEVVGRVIDDLQDVFSIEGSDFHARPSIGISMYPRDGATVENLVRAADTAMYAAKAAGKNQFRFFAEAMNDAVAHRLRIAAELRHALGAGELTLHYQPVLGQDARTVVGGEALLRWCHPESGLLAPGDFLAVAEESDLISEIDMKVLTLAVAQLAEWRRGRASTAFDDLFIAINLSARGLHEEGVVEHLVHLMAAHEVPAHCIELELTESMIMRDIGTALARLDLLRRLAPGLRIAIDDFGTGHASFEYLRRLPVDTLKVDRLFVADLDRPESRDTALAIIRSIVELGRNLDLTVTAEGVETADQAAYLARVGCHRQQGYRIAHPLPAAEFEAFVRGCVDRDDDHGPGRPGADR